MKANAITRIVIYSLLIVIALGVLVIGLLHDDLSVTIGTGITGVLPEGQAADEKDFNAAEIRQITVLWVSGQIDVLGADTDTVHYQTDRTDAAPQTVYTLRDGCLTIAFTDQALGSRVKSKNLSLTLPRCWDGSVVNIETISADIALEQLTRIEQLKTSTVSGTLHVSAVSAEKLVANTVSGEMELAGLFRTIDLDGVSAACTIDASAQCPESVCMDTVSGDLTLYLPEEYGFDLTLDAVSKSLRTGLSYTSDGNHHVSEGRLGLCRVDMNNVSGDVSIFSRETDSANCSHLWDEGTLTDVPGDNRTERVFTCLLCGSTKSTNVSSSRLFHLSVANEMTGSLLLEPLGWEYPAGLEVILLTHIVCDADLHLYVNGEFICSETARDDHWEFRFIMPQEDTVIELRTSGGM